ncbi:MAG: A/G-specific adenine glycosylase [bacterium]|nr:A/G-specific adenine glycosylase [bacterium]
MRDTPLGAPGVPPPAGLHEALLDWFAAHQRDLPWRRRRSLYGTWISEMMLQQTTVATVVPYWERFLARYPDVAALAAAPDDDVLTLWSGLGYYQRARHLLAAARSIVATSGGALPQDAAAWRRLPGVGPYAAGAIASIGLGLPEPAVDANVRRVLGRWYAGDLSPPAPGPAAVMRVAHALVPRQQPGAWNEALMELGATVCLPRQPQCAACPVAGFCRSAGALAAADGSAAARERPRALAVGVVLVVFRAEGRCWLEAAGGRPLACVAAAAPARTDFGRLHQGLLVLPMTAWYPLPTSPGDQGGALTALVGALGGMPGSATRLGSVRHAITRYRLQGAVLAVDQPGPAARPPLPDRPAGVWADAGRAADLHVSQLTRKALHLFRR